MPDDGRPTEVPVSTPRALASEQAAYRFSLDVGDLRLLGALGGSRTPNLLIRSQMLYPLSYERSGTGQCTEALRRNVRLMAGWLTLD